MFDADSLRPGFPGGDAVLHEETLLHTFEKAAGGGVASPHAEKTLKHIQALKKKHAIDYDTHASYRFVERGARTRKDKE